MGVCEEALKAKFSAIEELFAYLSNISADEKLKSHLARYMVMVVYAAFESGIKDAFYAHIDRTVQNLQIADHLKSSIKKNYRNVDFAQLLYLIDMFDACKDNLETRYKDTEITDSFNNIVTNRQSIAHGGLCTVTFSEIESYYNKAKPLLLDLANTLDSRQ